MHPPFGLRCFPLVALCGCDPSAGGSEKAAAGGGGGAGGEGGGGGKGSFWLLRLPVRVGGRSIAYTS